MFYCGFACDSALSQRRPPAQRQPATPAIDAADAATRRLDLKPMGGSGVIQLRPPQHPRGEPASFLRAMLWQCGVLERFLRHSQRCADATPEWLLPSCSCRRVADMRCGMRVLPLRALRLWVEST